MPVDNAVRDLLSRIPHTGNAVLGGCDSKSVALASTQLQRLAAQGGLQRAAAEIDKFMPQRNEDDNVSRLQALAGEDPVEAKQQEIEFFAYQLSNDLIEDTVDIVDYERDKSSKIMEIFNNIDLPLVIWKQWIMQSREDATAVAFTEKLFEAAVITRSVSLCEALLECGANPDKPIRSLLGEGFIRPIQNAVEDRAVNPALVKLLVRFGTGVDLTTEEHTRPALRMAAMEGLTECVRVLVEAGANITPAPRSRTTSTRVAGETPLSCAANGGWRENWPLETGRGLQRLRCLEYLLPLYDPECDHEIIQDALFMAARSHMAAMIPLIVEAGADISEGIPNGHTPLTQALSSADKSNHISAIETLFDLGADPNCPYGLPGPSTVTPLHIAAVCGKPGLIRLLVERGADLNARAVLKAARQAGVFGFGSIEDTSSPITPLWLLTNSIVFGDRERAASALYMLRAGASLMGGEFALVPILGSVELIHELLARGADINEADRSGRTALQNALRFRKWNVVEVLLGGGAELRGGEVFTAIEGGSRATVETLLRRGARFDHDGVGVWSILEAGASKNSGLATWLIETHGVPYHPIALCATVCSGLHQSRSSEEELEVLLKARDPNKPGGLLTATAIGHAAYHADSWILDRLLAFKTQSTCLIPLRDNDEGYYRLTEGWGIEVYNDYDERFWRRSCIRTSVLVPPILAANWDEARLLLDAGHKPDRLTLFVAIMVASTHDLIDRYWGDADDVEEHKRESLSLIRRITKFLAAKDIQQPARRNLPTPLQAAAKARRVDITRHLLSLGADINSPPSKIIDLGGGEVLLPRTAFQAAVETGEVEMIELLLDAGADIHAESGYDSGATALQLAAGNGYIGIARRLIALGADVNAAGARRRGRTALQAAAERGRLDMVQFLLECGAAGTMDRSIESRDVYWRARRLARRNGHIAVDGLLQAYEERMTAGRSSGDFEAYEMGSDGSCSFDEGEDDEDEGGYYSPEDDGSVGDDEGWGEGKGENGDIY